jgi:hypothetical protein
MFHWTISLGLAAGLVAAALGLGSCSGESKKAAREPADPPATTRPSANGAGPGKVEAAAPKGDAKSGDDSYIYVPAGGAN